MAADRRSRPLAAVLSQGIVAGSSLVLQLIALRELGTDGLGAFAVLFGILVTINSVQSGWLGDSLTVLDRFDPGIRRALVRSQLAILVLVFVGASVLSLPIAGVDATTALLFGLASVAWVFEETLRRLLIARREFWKLVVNDAAFAVGSFGLVGFVLLTGGSFSLETLIVSLLAGATVAIGVGVVQLPRVELSRGLLGPTRMREVASFAVWRAAQIGLRPGSQALVRVIVVAAASYEALGQLEAARLLLAPVLTVVNGAGVYLLPTYAAQAKAGAKFRPSVPAAMLVVGGIAALYGVLAVALRVPLTDILTDEPTAITVVALLAWTAYSVGFGAGVPAGNAMVARGRSRTAFGVRVIDAVAGVGVASVFAVVGWVEGVPFGLAVGTLVGAVLLLRRLAEAPEADSVFAPPTLDTAASDAPTPPIEISPVASIDAPLDVAPDESQAFVWTPVASPRTDPLPPPSVGAVTSLGPVGWSPPAAAARASAPPPQRTVRTWRPTTPVDTIAGRARDIDRYLWLLPLLLIVATEYKFRRRPIDDALGGSIDIMIAVELGVYALVGVWAVYRLAPTTPRLTPLTVAMWGYILTTAASALYSTFPMLALARAVQLVIIGAVIHVVATDGRLGQINKLVHGWIVLLTISIAAGIAYVAPTTRAQEGRFTWLFVHSVSAGSMLALSVPMLFGLWMTMSRSDNRLVLPWPRWAYGALLAVHILFLLLTRTRGSIGGAMIAVAVMAWIMSGQKAKPQLVLGSLVVSGAFLLAFGGVIIEFLTRGETVESIGTFNRRTEIWTLAWDAFMSRPLHGLGFTSAKGVFFDETGLGGAHNALINVMIDAGLAGLVWWTALLVAVGVGIGRLGPLSRSDTPMTGACGSLRADRCILLGMYIASMINSVTTEGLGAGVNVSAIWLFLMVAWISTIRRESVPIEPPSQDRDWQHVPEIPRRDDAVSTT
jgi:exopolysaccharide production protein ExoQ